MMRELTSDEGENLFELLLTISGEAAKIELLGCPLLKGLKESLNEARRYLADNHKGRLLERKMKREED